MGFKMTRSPWWCFKKLCRDYDINNNSDDKDVDKYRGKEEEHQQPRQWQWQWQWKFATRSSSSSWQWSKWRLKKKKKLGPINLVFPLRFSFSFILDDIFFRILYVIEAIVLVSTFCFYFCCCGCHV